MAAPRSVSGIQVDDELKTTFQNALKSKNLRWIRIHIKDDALKQSGTERRSASWRTDFPKIAKELTDNDSVYYIFWKGESKDGSDLMMITYVPDTANAKEKMQYSASKGALLALVGKDVEQYAGSTKAELTLEAYEKHLAGPKPLSYVEEQLKALPSQLDRKEINTAGFGLLAQLNSKDGAKPMPKALQKYVGGDNAAPAVGAAAGPGKCAHMGCKKSRENGPYCKDHAKADSSAAAGGGVSKKPGGVPKAGAAASPMAAAVAAAAGKKGLG